MIDAAPIPLLPSPPATATGPLWLVRLTLPRGLADQYAGDRYALHRAVYALWEGMEPGRLLFRLDGAEVLAQAPAAPRLLACPEWYWRGAEVAVREWTPRFAAGTEYAFRLRCNPARLESATRRRVALESEAEQRYWLDHRLPGPAEYRLEDRGEVRFRKPDGWTVTYREVEAAGRLRCDDPARLAAAVRAGIGRGKAFGLGLLTLARLPGDRG